jgi:hypothetical protein
MDIYKQVFVTSINKAINSARATGYLNLKNLAIYNLYKKSIEFTEGNATFLDENKLLKSIITDLKYKYPQDICNYKKYVPTIGFPSPYTNLSPTVSPASINLLLEESIFFQEIDFKTGFSDPNGNGPGRVLLYLTGLAGTFKYNGVVKSTTLELNIEEVIYLEYTRVDASAFSFSLPFRVSDDYMLNRKWTGIVNNTVDGTIVGNQPAIIGDNTILVSNREVKVLTLSMFTDQLTPPYSDPESDLIDAIRLDEISMANLGIFYVNGIQVIEGQIITREDINAGLFTYEAPDQDALYSDNFSFSARDEGSLIWVS